jgi:hypothetical protein
MKKILIILLALMLVGCERKHYPIETLGRVGDEWCVTYETRGKESIMCQEVKGYYFTEEEQSYYIKKLFNKEYYLCRYDIENGFNNIE